MDDVISIIEDDHREVLTLLHRVEIGEIGPDAREVDDIVRELSVHAGVEELVVYPAAREFLPTGDTIVSLHLREHQLVKELLVQIERGSGSDRLLMLASLAAYVRAHADHEETVLLPRLREHLSAEQLQDMGDAFAKAKKVAPTHPHPHAPNTPPANVVADAAASVLDQARDRAAGRSK